jgi:hypothetical protein
MTVETASYISQLNTALPASGDPKSEGDDHLRLVKNVLKTQFPNFGTNAVTPTATEVNYLGGVTSAIQTQLDGKGAVAGQSWTGTHNFTGATVTVPTLSPGSSGNGAASVDYANALSFAAALPAQTGNAGKFVTTNGAAASWASVEAAFKNRIINGKMNISQRGTSFAAIASGSYSLDRWVQFNTTTAVYTVSQQADAPNDNEFQNSLRVAITTADTSIAAGDQVALRQWVEGFNARSLIDKTFTLSFWVRSAKTGVHCVALKNTGGDRTVVFEYTVSAANTWEKKTLTLNNGLITAGTWNWTDGQGLALDFTLAAGTTYQTTAGAWQTGNFLATSNQVNCLDTVGNIFAITGVQLEVGSNATSFEHRAHGAELALCQRYLPAFNGVTIIGAGWGVSATQAFIEVIHSVTPRIAPTGLTASAAGTFTIYGSGAASVTPTSITLNAGGTSNSRISVVTASGLSAGIGTGFYANSASSQLLFTGCEL